MTKVTKLSPRRRERELDGCSAITDILALFDREAFTSDEFQIELEELCAIHGVKAPNPIQVGIKLKKLGYEVDWKQLNASEFGVPQLRPRVRQD